MKRFVQGQGRTQSALLPECLDDYVAEDNAVRVIDVFVDELDLGKLGFQGVDPLATGRPAYHPSVLLKIYVYGSAQGQGSIPPDRTVLATLQRLLTREAMDPFGFYTAWTQNSQ